MTNFITPNSQPDLTFGDVNTSVELFIGAKAEVTALSTSGLERVAAVDPGSYKVATATGINKTKLGVIKSTKNIHYNDQSAEFTVNTAELTPIGRKVINKSTNEYTVTMATSGFTTATLAVGGAAAAVVGTNAPWLMTMSSTTNLQAGSQFAITLPGVTTLLTAYPIVDAVVSATSVSLRAPLDQAPADGQTIYRITKMRLNKGGTTPKKRFGLFVITGDDQSELRHEIPECFATDGSEDFPDAKQAMSMLKLEAISQTGATMFYEDYQPPYSTP